jgi:prepilin-type N-terminal cleavage/methylation domain-containing protein
MNHVSTHHKTRAFTLIELVVVIVVLGILSTIAIVGYQTVINKSTEAKQVSRMTQVLKEAKVLYVQNIYSDPSYTWAQAVTSAVGDLPTYTVDALSNWSEGAQATGFTSTSANNWTATEDSTNGPAIYSAAPNDIVMKEVAGVMYVASATSTSVSKGVFGMVSQTTAPFVWVAGCSDSTCSAATASSGPPAGGSYASGTTAVTTTGPTTTVLTCATGGACAVGNTGPGGGIVFYVQAAGGTFPCGATLTTTCRYLEAAPTSGAAAWTDATYVWSGNTTTGIGAAAQGVAVGTGLKNTEAIVAQNSTAGRAGTITRAYRGPNNLSDWYLPSKDELNQMCKWQRGQSWVSDAAYCSGSGGTNTGPGASGFFTDMYWSSSEFNPTGAWFWFFFDEYHSGHVKSTTHYVRPVRAF